MTRKKLKIIIAYLAESGSTSPFLQREKGGYFRRVSPSNQNQKYDSSN